MPIIMKILKALVFFLFFTTSASAQFLGERTYDIESVKVTARGEDRAYRIMRNAIARAPYYRDQVAGYNAEVYLKGSLDVVKISSFMRAMGGEDMKEIKEGDNFMEESVSEIDFTAPRTYRQRVIRQMNSMPDGTEQGAEQAIQLINFNIYDTEALVGGIIISPLSPGAFNHYKFVYEGYTEDGDRLINKIRVTPRRESQQLLEGYMYIAEDFWNVHEVDLSGHMNIVVGVDFRLEANYSKVTPTVWMPSNYRIVLNMSLLGSRMTMNYVASSKYNSLTESPAQSVAEVVTDPDTDTATDGMVATRPLSTPTTPAIPENLSTRQSYRLARQTSRQLAASKRPNKYDLTEELSSDYKVTVDSLAGEPDPEFWDRNRPVALTPAELEGYSKRDITATKKTDTTASRGTPLAVKVLMGTYKPIKLGSKGGELQWRGLLAINGGFNTVDGYYIGWRPIAYRKNFSGKTSLSLRPEAIWAIDRHVGLGSLTARLSYAPMRRGKFNLDAGSLSRDFNGGGGGIGAFENTIASLFFRRNYLKLYQDNFVEATNTIDIANGLALTVGGKFARRLGLWNTTDYSFFYRGRRDYTPNTPVDNLSDPGNSMPNHNALTVTAGIEYTPRQYYRISGGRKVPVRSAWPTFFADWRKGVSGPLGSIVDFDHVSGGIRQNISPGQGQWINYSVRGGVFVNKKNLYFSDFHHFSTHDIPLLNRSIAGGEVFNLLPYYRYSTADRYLQAHVSYSARFLILKLLPWVSKRLWQEGLQAGYLTTPVMRHYTEFGYTIGLFWQAGVFVGFEGTKFRGWGAKLSIPIRVDSEASSISIAL
jgi:hypothetical protein